MDLGSVINDVVDFAKKTWNNGSGTVFENMVNVVYQSDPKSREYTQEKYYSWRIFGSPYMLLDDPPQLGGYPTSDVLGEWYYSQLKQSQILTLKIGVPKYTGNKRYIHMIDYIYGNATAEDEEENSWWDNVVDNVVSYIGMSITGLNQARRQYIFYNQYELYIKYVRMILISLASYLGLMEFPIPSIKSNMGSVNFSSYEIKPIKEIDWNNYVSNGNKITAIWDLFSETVDTVVTQYSYQEGQEVSTNKPQYKDTAAGAPAIIQFMVQPSFSNESFQNTTKPSSAAQFASSFENQGREVQWITQTTGSNSFVASVADVTTGVGSTLATAIENVKSDPAVSMFGSTLVGMIRGLAGERMIWPEIYDQSGFEKSVSYNIRLVSPQGDPYSYFVNIGIPLSYLIAAAAPLTASRNAYKMPFMCQAYVTGQTSMPMAIISGLSIQRGTAGAVNKDGLPLEVECNISIKDLYSVLAFSAIHDPAEFLSNESMIEYIASWTGIETWNKSLMNKYLRGDISKEVGNSLNADEIIRQVSNNLGKWGAEQLYMYNIANVTR